jgi:beta-mannosidase
MYPGDSTFLKSVEEELNYQIPRISTHPSVILLNGNNEVDLSLIHI